MTNIAFTRNFTDRSNDSGFQFEFFCDKCGNGHMSSFQRNTLGVAAHLVKAAGWVFGHQNLGWGADQVKDAFRGSARDNAFQAAVTEIMPSFHQCTRCGKWVCPAICWNEKRGMCEACAPDLAEEVAHLQAKVAVEQAHDQVRHADQLHGFDVNRQGHMAACPHCSARIEGAGSFCNRCGKQLTSSAGLACPRCATSLPSGAKFCGSCGTHV